MEKRESRLVRPAMSKAILPTFLRKIPTSLMSSINDHPARITRFCSLTWWGAIDAWVQVWRTTVSHLIVVANILFLYLLKGDWAKVSAMKERWGRRSIVYPTSSSTSRSSKDEPTGRNPIVPRVYSHDPTIPRRINQSSSQWLPERRARERQA